ncbi:MAG: beta-ketoacyl-[acyl-carrier-protein] synthase family protein [Pseudomonadota bacterium]
MAIPCVYISAMGVVSSLGRGVEQTAQSLFRGVACLSPLEVFPMVLPDPPLVGQVAEPVGHDLPRTHELALIAVQEALGEPGIVVPDAIVLGATTGGMLRCESLLKVGETDPLKFFYHALGSVADYLAGIYGCTGPVITVSTACSSGNAALTVGLELIRSGLARTVLAGGADSLCRMTCHGFASLQVVDPAGARPFDRMRGGMSVAEGAGMLLLTAEKPDHPIVELSGGGLSCDAFHASSPHPDGNGAFQAMAEALADAGIGPEDIDYINLHGTGTQANDQAEALAVNRLFGPEKPWVSSVKGAMGHPMAAAGAIEAVISAIAVSRGLVPPNVGFSHPDPGLDLIPVASALNRSVSRVLSNGFGFGGNNACVVISRPGSGNHRQFRQGEHRSGTPGLPPMTILGLSCITGAGTTHQTLDVFYKYGLLSGCLPDNDLSGLVPLKKVRRLKRLSRLMLALALQAREQAGRSNSVSAVFGGTGWGSLSETWDFLNRLFATGEKRSSPTDFVGSVHNAACGQVAMELDSHGPNITTTGGDHSFEQALWTSGLLASRARGPFMVMGGDEFHPELSPRFDMSVKDPDPPSDGGGALVLVTGKQTGKPSLTPLVFCLDQDCPDPVQTLVDCLRAMPGLENRYGAVMAGIPKAFEPRGKGLLARFLDQMPASGPVIDYRKLTGEFASASAVATVLAADAVARGKIPDPGAPERMLRLNGRGVLVLGFGRYLTAVEVMPG